MVSNDCRMNKETYIYPAPYRKSIHVENYTPFKREETKKNYLKRDSPSPK